MPKAMPSMTMYQPGDIVLIGFPLGGSGQRKVRPALVILDSGDADIVVARLTTQIHQSSFDIALSDWKGAGPKVPTVVRLHKLATLEKSLVQLLIGSSVGQAIYFRHNEANVRALVRALRQHDVSAGDR